MHQYEYSVYVLRDPDTNDNTRRRMMNALEKAAIPACAPTECWDAPSFAEAVYQAALELDLIDEGQEAAECYTKRQVKQLRKFVADNRAKH